MYKFTYKCIKRLWGKKVPRDKYGFCGSPISNFHWLLELLHITSLSPAWPSSCCTSADEVSCSEPTVFQIIWHWQSIKLNFSEELLLKISFKAANSTALKNMETSYTERPNLQSMQHTYIANLEVWTTFKANLRAFTNSLHFSLPCCGRKLLFKKYQEASWKQDCL